MMLTPFALRYSQPPSHFHEMFILSLACLCTQLAHTIYTPKDKPSQLMDGYDPDPLRFYQTDLQGVQCFSQNTNIKVDIKIDGV